MSIIIALLLGGVFGAMLGALWRDEELEALAKKNASLQDDLDDAQQVVRLRTRKSWVN